MTFKTHYVLALAVITPAVGLWAVVIANSFADYSLHGHEAVPQISLHDCEDAP